MKDRETNYVGLDRMNKRWIIKAHNMQMNYIELDGQDKIRDEIKHKKAKQSA